MAAQGFGRDNPYCSAVVELDEGPRVVARIEGVDAKQPKSIRIGMRLAAQFATCDSDSYATPPLIFTPG
jgi:uncharacterized OB-fold protein